MLIRGLENDLRRRGYLCLYMRRHGDVNRMREPQLHIEPPPAPAIHRPPWILLHSRSIPDTDEVQGHLESLRDAGDGVGDQRARRAPHCALLFLVMVGDGDGERGGVLARCEGDERVEGYGGLPERAGDGEGVGGVGVGDGGGDGYGCLAYPREGGGGAAECSTRDVHGQRKGGDGLAKQGQRRGGAKHGQRVSSIPSFRHVRLSTLCTVLWLRWRRVSREYCSFLIISWC